MNEPKVSVVLCTYNGAGRVQGAISSVLGQEMTDLELIVIDDASTDGVFDVVSGVEDLRLRAVRLASNGGVYAARNHALSMARGAYIAFIDDDDAWMPDKLTRQLALFAERAELGLVHCGATDVMPDGRRLKRLPPVWADEYAANLVADGIITSSVIVPRTVFDSVGTFDATMRSFADWDMWLKVAAKYPVAGVGLPLVIATQHDGSIQHGAADSLAFHRGRVLAKHWSETVRLGLEDRVLAFHYYFVAKKLLTAGRRREARALASKSIGLRRDGRTLALFLLTFLSEDRREQTWNTLANVRRALRV
jgi:glycosyltransferase involved in cell wall biosynthesis